jgi:hypothetical protein
MEQKTDKKVVYLGTSSFVYTLQTLGKDFYFPTDTYIVLILPDKRPFPIEMRKKNSSAHCGYIVIDSGTLEELFRDDTAFIRKHSERKFNGAFYGIEHCSASENPENYGKVLVTVNGKEFSCYYSPQN